MRRKKPAFGDTGAQFVKDQFRDRRLCTSCYERTVSELSQRKLREFWELLFRAFPRLAFLGGPDRGHSGFDWDNPIVIVIGSRRRRQCSHLGEGKVSVVHSL